MSIKLFKTILIFITLFATITFADKCKSKLGVIGGRNSQGTESAHYVTITIKCGDQASICGGGLVTPFKAVTAAHCLFGFNKFIICHGNNGCANKAAECITATKAYIHPQFFSSTLTDGKFKYDLGVILMDETFKRTKFRLLEFPPPNTPIDTFRGRTAVISGCGAINGNTKQLPDNVVVGCNRIVSVKEAQKAGFNYNEKDNLLWAVGNEAGQGGSCSGDSGGPLLVPKDNSAVSCTDSKWFSGSHYCVGLVSFGDAACSQSSPIAYTYIVPYLSFMQNPEQSNCTNLSCGFQESLLKMSPLHALKVFSSMKNEKFSPTVFNCQLQQLMTKVGYLGPGMGGVPGLHNGPVSDLVSSIIG